MPRVPRPAHDLGVGPWSTADAAIGGMDIAIRAYARELGGSVHGFAVHRNGVKSYGARGLVLTKKDNSKAHKRVSYNHHYCIAGVTFRC